MPSIRMFGGPLNEMDVEVDVVPRIGERIEVVVGDTRESVKPHYLRVHDVLHKLESTGQQIGVFVVEEDESKLLPPQ